jgi:predicted RNA-binding protein with RPS1 domain
MSWNNEERLILERMFPDNYTKNICEILGRSYSSVATKARVMGLKKSKTFIKIELERQANRLKNVGAKSRFKKGTFPAAFEKLEDKLNKWSDDKRRCGRTSMNSFDDILKRFINKIVK